MPRRLIHTESTADQTVTVKVYKDSDTQEYVARVFARGDCLRDADYFTDDKTDAIGTARDMLTRADNAERALDAAFVESMTPAHSA